MQPNEKILGMTVIDCDGVKVGKIEALYADEGSDEPAFATVLTGLFGGKTNFFPLSVAKIESEQVVLSITKKEVENAPSIDPDGELSDEDEQRLYDYYDSKVESTDDEDTPGKLGQEPVVTGSDEHHADKAKAKANGNRARLRKYVITETTMRDGVPQKQVRTERIEMAEDEKDEK